MDSREIKIKNTLSNRSFGLIFFVIFSLITTYFVVFHEKVSYPLVLISLFFLILSLLAPKVLGPLNRFWFFFGTRLGSIISKIIMFLIYFMTIVPTGLIFKILKKDLLKVNYEKNLESYWIKKEDSKSSLKNQF
tara:strand:+ start:282 stop:683 length:402 start_codon:yes stop_codon:yes gene_type:complete